MYYNCIFLLQNTDQSANYCLKLKLWNNPCPPKCERKVEGEIGNLEEAQAINYDLDCLEIIRKCFKAEDRDALFYFCQLYEQVNPFCNECQYPRYLEDPFAEMDSI
ncbi:MAG: hypothetical protein ACFFAU_06550 [Candidatus Hodarchaeota archaeon]